MAFAFIGRKDASLIRAVFEWHHLDVENCTVGGIDEFPNWFTDSKTRYDYALLCFAINMYLFLGVAIVCDEYCVPSVERLCYNLGLSYGVAGATFLAMATSSPEFFVHLYATFLTEGDMGIGTIVGSSTFNALAITGFCGIVAGKGFSLDWWPLSRDLLWYTLNIILLTMFMYDGYIYWYEALVLFICFLVNMTNLSLDRIIQKRFRDRNKPCPCIYFVPLGPVQEFEEMLNPDNTEEETYNFCQCPVESNLCDKFIWFISYPWEWLMFLTIPNVRQNCGRGFHLLTLLMSIVWISLLTYLISWMLTVVGYYLRIPDSVMGITFLAIGTSIPEAISSVIVTRKGYGSMAVCNTVGSNNFNIAFCLGVPWLFKTLLFSSTSEMKAVAINSTSLYYSTGVLVASSIILYASFLATRFQLGFGVGVICLISYLSYISMAVGVEMFFYENENLPPHCPHKD